ncbi:MAG: hypothetical protein ABJI00_06940 [Paracoccaceae bacterium]
MDFTKALPVEWMEDMTSLADNSGPAFFAIFCMIVGIFLINAKTRRKHIAGYFSFMLAGAIITSITLISTNNQTYRYDFKIFDAASTQSDVEAGQGLEVIASEQEDVWLKSRNSVNQFYLIALRNEPFKQGDTFELYVHDPKTLELTRHIVRYCAEVSNPLFDLHKIADAPEGADNLQIVTQDNCDETVALAGWGAAFAQSLEPSPLAGKLKLNAASTIALRYYDKASDQGRVSEAVNELIASEATSVRAFSEPSKSNSRSNALWFGSEVPPEVAGALAIELIENGVKLQYFGPYVRANTRINTVEVGYSAL